MRFLQDLLFLEIETAGNDTDKSAIIQLSGLLLDKDSLLEKSVFNSYIKTSLLEQTLSLHASLLKINLDILRKSPKTLDCLKLFSDQFSPFAHPVVQSVQTLYFLRSVFRKNNLPFPYETHALDLWTLEYMFTQKIGLKKVPSLYTMLDYFKLTQKNPNNALERARLEAEVFRKIVKYP